MELHSGFPYQSQCLTEEDKSDSDGNFKQGMNEVTLAVAAKVTFCSGILRFLTPGLKDEHVDLC